MRTKSIGDLARVVNRRLRRDAVDSLGVPALTRLLESVYFASLKTEEGKPLQVRVALVDPGNADPNPPPMPRPDRWEIIPLTARLVLTVANLVKLSKAADPWSSCLAVFMDSRGEFFVWGLIDQTVHFNVLLVRETGGGGYAPPGLFQVFASGAADLSVYRGYSFVARLQQDQLLTRQSDVFSKGPIRRSLVPGITRHLRAISRQLSLMGTPDYLEQRELLDSLEIWQEEVSQDWLGTLSRLLISIQRYRHGGALLVTRSTRDLNIKYRIDYPRLSLALSHLAAHTIAQMSIRDRLNMKYLEDRKKFIPRKLYVDEQVTQFKIDDCKNEITGCVRFISSMSCVDGLILATPDLFHTRLWRRNSDKKRS